MENGKGKLFFGGLPTLIDVGRFFEQYGTPAIGTMIAHEAIAACIGAPWRSNRYRTVLNVVRRKLLKEHNLDTSVEPGQGLKILTSLGRIEATEGDFRSFVRKGRKAAVRISITPDEGLSEEQKRRREHVQQITTRAYMAAATEVKALKPPPLPQALPRR